MSAAIIGFIAFSILILYLTIRHHSTVDKKLANIENIAIQTQDSINSVVVPMSESHKKISEDVQFIKEHLNLNI